MNLSTYRNAQFNQSDYLNSDGQNPASEDGACHIFSLKWLQTLLVDNENNAQNRMQKLALRNKEVQILNKAFDVAWDNNEMQVKDTGIAHMLGMNSAGLGDERSIAAVGLRAMGLQNRQALVYTFSWQDGSAHSIAFYSLGNEGYRDILVFEPNFGEYQMCKQLVRTWLRELDRDQYNGTGEFASNYLRSVTKR